MANLMAQKSYFHQSQLAGELWSTFESIWTPGSTRSSQILRNFTKLFRVAGPFVLVDSTYIDFRCCWFISWLLHFPLAYFAQKPCFKVSFPALSPPLGLFSVLLEKLPWWYFSYYFYGTALWSTLSIGQQDFNEPGCYSSPNWSRSQLWSGPKSVKLNGTTVTLPTRKGEAC